MNKYILLLAFTMIMAKGFGQHKTITLYYPDDSTNVVSIANLDSMAVFICGASKVNYGGKAYNTVLIGDQCWLKENLDVGEMIQGTSNQTDNSVIEKYCYNNNPTNCTTYGGLYQWNEAMQYVTTEGARGICPEGWHIPTLDEFNTLSASVSGDGNSLKAVGQGIPPNGLGTNTSGFSGLLAGNYNFIYNYFDGITHNAFLWGSNEYSSNSLASILRLYHYNSSIDMIYDNKNYGFSVRCIKD